MDQVRPVSPCTAAVLAAVLFPGECRADIAVGPEYFAVPTVFAFFGAFIVLVGARLALLGLREVLARIGGHRRGEGADRRSAGGGGTPCGDGENGAGSKGCLGRHRAETMGAALFALLVLLWSFEGYREAQARRGDRIEAKSNLGGIRSTQVAYYAEWGVWVGNQPFTPVANRAGNRERLPWNDDTRFSILGFAPEGEVVCSYSLEGSDWPATAFTARAECDLDADGRTAIYTITSADTEIRKSGAPF